MGRTVGLAIAGLIAGGWVGLGWWTVQGGDPVLCVIGGALLGSVAIPWISRGAGRGGSGSAP